MTNSCQQSHDDWRFKALDKCCCWLEEERWRKKKFKEQENRSRKEDRRFEWSRMKCSRSNNTERSERVGWDCQEPITLWASNSHTRPMSRRFNGPPCLRSERIRSIRYQKGKVNVSKKQMMSFFNWSVGFPDWFVELKGISSRQNRSKNKLFRENSVARAHGSWSLRVIDWVMDSWYCFFYKWRFIISTRTLINFTICESIARRVSPRQIKLTPLYEKIK